MTIELAKGVHWIGVVDWALKHFHGFELSTHRGSTYNAYLVRDEKIAVVDTVWGPFAGQYLENLRSLVDPARIDYVVVNHAETDHSGSLPALMALAPNATIVCSRKGAESIPGHYHQKWPTKIVKTGDSIGLGAKSLVFVEAPMLHWPDTMFTYVAGVNILLSNDAFGQHYATSFRFNDQVDQAELFQEARKYYANILTPFSELVLKKIEEVLSLGLAVDMICPSHGVIWRKDPLQIVRQYQEWARQVPERRAAILYDTMWEGTRRMAEAIAEGLAAEGVPAGLYHMASSDRNDVIAEVFRAKAVIVGSPTLNRGLLPTIAPVLEDLKGLRFRNKIGAGFGTYGWSGESLGIIEEHLKSCGFPVPVPGVKAMWQPGVEDLARCVDLGRKVAKAMV